MSAALTAEEVELWHLLEGADGADSVLDFVPTVTPGFKRPVHLAAVADLLARCEKGPTFAGVHVPVRHGKTELLMHGLVRLMTRHPDWIVGYMTYSWDQARTKSIAMQEIAARAGLAIGGTLKEWRTPQGGGMITGGVKGRWTGMGLRLLVVDDPYKDRIEAESKHRRDVVYQQLKGTAWSRLDAQGSVIVNHARWHYDDLIGRLSRDRDFPWEILSLPAIDDQGRALWEEKWPAKVLELRRRIVGPYEWASLYQGVPVPAEGVMFDPDRAPRYKYAKLKGARLAIGCDPAATASTSSDYSAAVVMAAQGHGIDQVVYVLEVYHRQVEVPALMRELAKLQQRWGCPVGIEAVGLGKAVPQVMRDVARGQRERAPEHDDPFQATRNAARRQRLRIVDLPARGDKKSRAIPYSAAWHDGRVQLPARAHWLDDFVAEHSVFTGSGDAHDDQVDASAHAFSMVNRGSAPSLRGATLAETFAFG